MKTKLISMFLLTAILCLAVVSAVTISVTTPDDLSTTNTQSSFIITNNGAESVDVSVTLPTSIDDGAGNEVTINAESPLLFSNVASGASETVEFSYAGDLDDFALGDFSDDVTIYSENIADDTDNSTQTVQLTVSKAYCEAGNTGNNLKIDRIDFDNNGLGKDDEWFLTDEISIKIRVKNIGNEDIDNVIIEWGLYDTKQGEFILDEEEDDVNIDEDEKETWEFTITIDPDDFDEDFNENDFIFYVKAYGDDLGESTECVADTEDLTVRKDKHFVILNNIQLNSDSIPCGEYLEGSFEVWNIGDHDEDDVSVTIESSELGINEDIMIGDMDILEDKKVSFSLLVPSDATEKLHTLTFKVFDEDNDVFENDDNDEAKFNEVLRVEGNCQNSPSTQPDAGASVRITAELSDNTPEAVAGEKVVVEATIKNTGDTTTTYTVSLLRNSAWSSLDSISPKTFTLDAGESEDVEISLKLDDDVEGKKEFTIKTSYNDQVEEQKVALFVAETSAQSNAFSEHMKANWFIYVIALVNLILIIAIILVIRRIVAPKPGL